MRREQRHGGKGNPHDGGPSRPPRDEREALRRLAEAITDETPVDWTAEEQSHPRMSDRFSKLRLIEAIAEAHRSAPFIQGEILFEWGRLKVLDVLGSGGFGTAYRAYDPLLQREVALKLLREDLSRRELNRRRFLEEGRRMARVRHPNVLAIHGAAIHDGRVGFWADLLEGATLEERLSAEGTLGWGEATVVGIELCRALAAVHAAGIVHGDVKASNVMREAGGRIVLMDFGAGSELASGESGGTVLGTPLAMAPELFRGEAPSPASDLYALGVLLYRLVTGRYPATAGSVAELRSMHRRGERAPLLDVRPDLPLNWVHRIEKALSPDPKARYATAGELESALAATLQNVGASGADEGAAGRLAREAVIASGTGTAGSASAGGAAAAAPPAAGSAARGAAPELEIGLSGKARRRLVSMLAAAVVVVIGGTLLLMKMQGSRKPAMFPGPQSTTTASSPAAPSGAAPSSRSVPPSSTAGTGSVPVLPALTANVTLYRSQGAAREALAPGALLRPGDMLFMEVQGSERMYTYVLNEDQAGEVYVLFPLANVDERNPLSGRAWHRLPGSRDGVPQNWQVTSGQGRETFIVIASRASLPRVEEQIAKLPPASPDRAVAPARIDPRLLLGSRGVGGMVEAEPSSQGETAGVLSDLARFLTQEASDPGGLWIRQFEMYNLGR